MRLLCALAATAALTACREPVSTGAEDSEQAAGYTSLVPDFESYRAYVDPALTRSCGTLDCHGDERRSYRLFGFSGRRVEPSHAPGKQPTTEAEVRANYQAFVAFSPRELAIALDTGAMRTSIDALPLMNAVLDSGRHRFPVDGPLHPCVVSWLRVAVARADGTYTTSFPAMDPLAIDTCVEAERFGR